MLRAYTKLWSGITAWSAQMRWCAGIWTKSWHMSITLGLSLEPFIYLLWGPHQWCSRTFPSSVFRGRLLPETFLRGHVVLGIEPCFCLGMGGGQHRRGKETGYALGLLLALISVSLLAELRIPERTPEMKPRTAHARQAHYHCTFFSDSKLKYFKLCPLPYVFILKIRKVY